MAQLTAQIVSYDDEFKRQISRLLRACGVPVGIVEGRAPRAPAPDLVVVDIRADASSGMAAIERLRAGSAQPRDLRDRRGGRAGPDPPGDARRRERVLPVDPPAARPGVAGDGGVVPRRGAPHAPRARGGASPSAKQPCVTHAFLGAKGGAGTTTVAVNCGVELARADEAADGRSST